MGTEKNSRLESAGQEDACIDIETAQALRELVFGFSNHVSGTEWLKSGFKFRTFPKFGLQVPKTSLKSIVMCVQAYVLKHLMFPATKMSRRSFAKTSNDLEKSKALEPNAVEQREAMSLALADIVGKCRTNDVTDYVICTLKPQNADETSPALQSDSNSSCYRPDGVTEKIVKNVFNNEQQMTNFVKKNVGLFVDGPGIILLLYSIVLTRTVQQIDEDFCAEQSQLVIRSGASGGSGQALVSLILTGVASPFVHNGVIQEALEQQSSNKIRSLVGVLKRSEFGLLIWNNDENFVRQLGSRLKTPLLPIWLTCCHDEYGILFNPKRELVRDHKAELLFQLMYFNSSIHQEGITTIDIDTRHHEDGETNDDIPPLEALILTKWAGARMDWNGRMPYF